MVAPRAFVFNWWSRGTKTLGTKLLTNGDGLHSFFYKNAVFLSQAEYSYFSADFRLKIFLCQGHPSTIFCKISVRISKYRLKISTAPERLNISG